MSATDKAPADATFFLDLILDKHHKRLRDSGVTVGLEFASKGTNSKNASAVMLHGYPCTAVVRITPLEQRRWGVPDAVIKYDKGSWESQTDAERAAVLDHELCHLVFDLDKDKNIQGDDAGRPKLKMRLHDWQVGGFDEVIARHGVATAVEAQIVRDLASQYQQLTLAFLASVEDDAVTVSGPLADSDAA